MSCHCLNHFVKSDCEVAEDQKKKTAFKKEFYYWFFSSILQCRGWWRESSLVCCSSSASQVKYFLIFAFAIVLNLFVWFQIIASDDSNFIAVWSNYIFESN